MSIPAPVDNLLVSWRCCFRLLMFLSRGSSSASSRLQARSVRLHPTSFKKSTLVRTVIVKKSTNSKCWRGCGEKETLSHCRWQCKLVQPLWRTVVRCLKKLELELPYDPAMPLLAYTLRKPELKETDVPQ